MTTTDLPTTDDLRIRVMQGGAIMVARHIASLLLKLTGVLLIARVLGPEIYGVFAAATGLASFAIALGQAGVGVFLLRYPGLVSDRLYGVASTLLAGSSLAIVLAIEAGAGLIANRVEIAGVETALRLLALALPFQIMILPAMARLERALDYRAVASVELAGQAIYYLVAAPMVLAGYGAMSLVSAYLMQHLLAFALAQRFANARLQFAWDASAAREILRYSTSFALSNGIWQARRLVNPLIVGPLLGAQAVGVIGMTIGLLDMFNGLATLGWRLAVATFGRVQHDVARLRQAITEGMELHLLIVGATLLGFGWFGDWLISWTIGAQWRAALDIYPYLALSYLTAAAFNPHSAAMSTLGNNNAMATYHTLAVALFAGVAVVGVAAFGLRGYGLAELAALPAFGLLHLFVARAVGAPDYRVAAIWWIGAALGLFWREFGVWAIAAPFAALLAPRSRTRLASIVMRASEAAMTAAPLSRRRSARSGGRRILILTCRDAAIDFRLPLANELQRLGHDVVYVWLRRRPIVTDLAKPDEAHQMSLTAFVRFAWSDLRRSDGLVVLNTTNLALPGSTLALQAIIGGTWCFDLHDDLLYDRRGLRRMIASWWQIALVRRSDFTVRAAPLLSELCPRSYHLGNASNICRTERRSADFANILILASVDQRFDFDFVRRTARLNPALRFTIHGHALAPGAAGKLGALTRACSNVRYAGGFDGDGLADIMAAYDVTLAPYVVNARSTRYIDPLRYYHCLNAGMEIISTGIPRARDFCGRLHIVSAPEEVGGLILKLARFPSDRKNAASTNEMPMWRDKAVRFMEILEKVEQRGRCKA